MNRVQALAQFNKLNKKFITVLGMVEDMSLLNSDLYLYREIEIDLYQETVTGDYDNYSIVAEVDLPQVMKEDNLNNQAREKIVSKYPLETQLSVIENVLEALADNAGIDATDLKEMNAYINEVKRSNSIRKQFYNDSPDYVYKTTEDIEAEIAETYDGGINDYENQVLGG